jgi:undecaprenyl-diphosphatase
MIRIGHGTPSFPAVRLAVVVAVSSAAGPYLARPTRRIGQLLVVLLTFGAAYLGVAGPNGLLAGIFLGWGVAALVHLAFGSPGGRPTTPQVTASLEELGIRARGVRLATRQPVGATLMLAQDDAGPLSVKVIGRDEADAQLLAKVWRFVAYKDSGPQLFLTRLQQLEHEAYVCLLARQAGVGVAPVLTTGTAGPGAALLVTRAEGGSNLAEFAASSVTDGLLDKLWSQVVALHSARMAHGRLNSRSVTVTDGEVSLGNFSAASVAATPASQGKDVAELLASTAELVGEERATDAAIRSMGKNDVARALPFLQSAALSADARPVHPLRRRELRDRLRRLRDLGARATGTEAPRLEELYRVKGSSLFMAIGLLLAVGALLSQVGSPAEMWNTLKDAQWVWVVLAFALSMAANFPFTLAYMGTVPIRLPLWRTFELQTAVRFSNIAIPGVGGAATQIRYLQKQGMSMASAVAAGGLLSGVSQIAAQLGVLVLAVVLAPDSFHLGEIDTGDIVVVVLIAILAVGVLAGVVFGVPRIRRAVMPTVQQAMSTLWQAVRSPRQLLLLLGGNAAAAVLTGFVLLASLEAYGARLSVWTLLAVNIAVAAVASLVPVPGGSSAVGAIGVSGVLITLGVATNAAVAAVLTYQLVYLFLPAVPGWWATRDLINDDYL